MDAYQAPLYQAARKTFLRVHSEQIAKGAVKYPEPLNPDSWTREQLIEHALQENIDQLHYLTALMAKEQDESIWKARAKKAEAEVQLLTRQLEMSDDVKTSLRRQNSFLKQELNKVQEGSGGSARLSEGRQ